MNIQITDTIKYENVKRVWNYGAQLIDENRVDGHISITFLEEDKVYTTAKMGMTHNIDLQEEYGFRFVSHEENIDNNKYYF